MPDNQDVCNSCGENILKGDIGLRSSKDLEQIMVVRRDHGVEKKIPLQPKVCGHCGFVSFYVDDPVSLKITSTDKPVDPNFKSRQILESDF
ncbi:hypothetical protein UZ36_03175 [Candidatus Nitromaritima sp. SCGC AAA799-C22]|nr:hypothetical protein UZ36_03175 [Candidatus Nitromaritima sp. SCGC AAA799-C22]